MSYAPLEGAVVRCSEETSAVTDEVILLYLMY
jgi:hypothetical protein